MSSVAWTAFDEGFLHAYQWSQALAGGAALPHEAAPVQLGPGEVAHARIGPVGISGYFGEDKQYRSSFFLIGGPVGLAVTGAASLAHNASKKAEAQRAAVPSWHQLGTAEIVVTNQRLIATGSGRTESLWYAEIGPLQLTPGRGGAPGVQLQPADRPLLRLESPGAPLLYVFVHYLVDGQAPGRPDARGTARARPAAGPAPLGRAPGNTPAIASDASVRLPRRDDKLRVRQPQGIRLACVASR